MLFNEILCKYLLSKSHLILRKLYVYRMGIVRAVADPGIVEGQVRKMLCPDKSPSRCRQKLKINSVILLFALDLINFSSLA